jgi:hypothetical protein
MRFNEFFSEGTGLSAEFKTAERNWGDKESQDNYHGSSINWGGHPSGLSDEEINSIFKYVTDDVKPIGAVGNALEKLISVSTPINKPLLSYRGTFLTTKQVENIQNALQQKKSFKYRSKRTMSFSNSKSVAWQFVTPTGGYRTRQGGVPIILEILVPAGTNVGRLNLTFGVGQEHILSKNSVIELSSIRPYRSGFILTGRII